MKGWPSWEQLTFAIVIFAEGQGEPANVQDVAEQVVFGHGC